MGKTKKHDKDDKNSRDSSKAKRKRNRRTATANTREYTKLESSSLSDSVYDLADEEEFEKFKRK
tara:strand:+ start:278 stop:469 length:192 start_codon:yes stop_codon:yes gene_type:complete